MQGYILRVQKVRDEDCIVYILTSDELVECYRFYGARHPVITQGFKLDFELVVSVGFLPHLRGTLHLGFGWLADRERLMAWQSFMRILYDHLKGVGDISGFYYELLEQMAVQFFRQNPRRVVVEAYLKLLDFEGRMFEVSEAAECFCCGGRLNSSSEGAAVVRGFLLAHPWCVGKGGIEMAGLKRAFENKSIAHLDDEVANRLYFAVLEGL